MKKIVVLGGGYAGLKTVVVLQKKLKREVQIILVDRHPYHYETTRLPEVATGARSYTKISYPLKEVLLSQMTQLVVDEVQLIDYQHFQVKLAHHADLKYDYLILGLGFVLSDFGIPGVKDNALPMYNVQTACKIRDHVYQQMRDYRQNKNPLDLQFVVCGAGFQAIELACALAENRPRYAQMAGGIDPDQLQVRMLTASQRLLPMFDDKQMHYALRLVKKCGVQIIRPAQIKNVQPDGVSYQTKKENDKVSAHLLKAKNIIWMMGFSGSPLIKAAGFKERRGRILVDQHLTVPDHPEIYALGDVSNVMVSGKKWPWPNTAQLALSMANYAAKDLAARIKGNSRPLPYSYHDLGVVVAVGDRHAAAYALGHNYRGYLASVLKKIIADKSLLETGGLKETLAVGRFDFYH